MRPRMPIRAKMAVREYGLVPHLGRAHAMFGRVGTL
jgi:hypothetical protein